jgi:hypothetical protein
MVMCVARRPGDIGLAVVTTGVERTGHCHASPEEVSNSPVEATTVEEGAGPGSPEPNSIPGVHIDIT